MGHMTQIANLLAGRASSDPNVLTGDEKPPIFNHFDTLCGMIVLRFALYEVSICPSHNNQVK